MQGRVAGWGSGRPPRGLLLSRVGPAQLIRRFLGWLPAGCETLSSWPPSRCLLDQTRVTCLLSWLVTARVGGQPWVRRANVAGSGALPLVILSAGPPPGSGGRNAVRTAARSRSRRGSPRAP